MRKDISKVLVERSRVGGSGDRKGRKAREYDDMPSKQSMKRSHSDRKSLNENLNPLKRFLNKSVGRPWDKVFSEISENLKLTSTVQKHVRDHVFDFVKIHIKQEGTKVFSQRAYYGSYYELWNGDLYVDAKGFLRKYKRDISYRKHKSVNPLAQALANISSSKSRTALDGTTIYKVYQNPDTEEWDLYNPANSTHARIDFNELGRYRFDYLSALFTKFPQVTTWNNEYVKTLYKLWRERKSRLDQEKAARAALPRGLFKVEQRVSASNDGKYFEPGIVLEVGDFPEKMVSGYKVVLDTGKTMHVAFGGEGRFIKDRE